MSSLARPGELMRTEIASQPNVVRGILDSSLPDIREVAAVIRERGPRMVLLAARGTSDNAALYAKYLVEVLLKLPAGLASPSTLTAYGTRPDFTDVLMVIVSQSGGSPDLVETASVARECGATVLAVTNAPASELAAVAELHLAVQAGDELAVAATKSYTAELLTLWMLVDVLRGGDASAARGLPDALLAQVDQIDEVTDLAQRYRFTDRMVLTGRGFSYPTVKEGALKLMETSYLSAHAFSGADLLHGPLAMIDSGRPVIAVVPEGAGALAMRPVLERLRDRGADLAVIGGPSSVAGAAVGLVVDHGLAEELSPIIDIVPLQQLAMVMAVGRGFDPDHPRGLSKVTHTW